MALGGRVAESLTFNRISTGAQNDLKKVTEMAYAQIRQFGMDPVVGPLSFPSDQEVRSGGGRKPFSKKLANTMDVQARLLVASVYKRTEELLNQNRDKLKLLAESLLEKETLNYSDVVQLIGPPPHGDKKKVDLLDFGPTQAAETPTEPPKESPPPPPPASANGSEEPHADDASQKVTAVPPMP
jgi:spastic paraplegia protein 7